MAFRMGNLRSMVGQMRGARPSIATSTAPKMKAATLGAHHAVSDAKVGEWAPIQIVFGMVSVAVVLAAHTAYQQLVRSPSVHVNKKKRESMPEVDQPDDTVDSADKFINHSLLRKFAHIQHNNTTLSDPLHPNPFTHPRNAETLKTAGIEPGKY